MTSLASLPGSIVRSRCTVENRLYRKMEMIFRNDEHRTRADHAPANVPTIKDLAHNLIREASGKKSLRVRRTIAARDDAFLASLSNA